jgi:predicted RNA-binding protein with TRAM domain
MHSSLKNEIVVTGTAVKETVRDEIKTVKNDFDARITKLEAVSR